MSINSLCAAPKLGYLVLTKLPESSLRQILESYIYYPYRAAP